MDPDRKIQHQDCARPVDISSSRVIESWLKHIANTARPTFGILSSAGGKSSPMITADSKAPVCGAISFCQ